VYEAETQSTIMQRMLGNTSNDVDKSEGSITYDALSPVAIELALAYTELNRVLNLSFAPTSSGQYLDYRAAEHGLTRKSATVSTGTVTITGSENTVIPAGSLFATNGGVQFETVSAATILSGGTVDVVVKAILTGSTGNVLAGMIGVISVAILGAVMVTNSAATTGGVDEESDVALLARLLQSVKNPATSGNVAHYLQWATEVDGVGSARVIAPWNGPLTVKVVLLDGSKQPADTSIVSAVASHIESVRPVGADVTVVAATGLTINVVATLTLQMRCVLADVTTTIQNNLISYLKSIAFVEGAYVSYAKIGDAILNSAGVQDYSGLTVNGGTANITPAIDHVAIVGTVNFTT